MFAKEAKYTKIQRIFRDVPKAFQKTLPSPGLGARPWFLVGEVIGPRRNDPPHADTRGGSSSSSV